MPDARLAGWAVVLRVAVIVGFAALLLDSVVTAVRWWQGDLVAPTRMDWVEIGLLPVLLYAYLRYFSVLRPDCRACDASARHSPPGPSGP